MSADRGFIVDRRPQRRTRDQIDQILAILARCEDVLPLTLRQLFYILVAAQIIDKTNNAYRALGYTVRKARRARMIDFDAIADDGSTLPRGLVGFDCADDLRWSIKDAVEVFDLNRQTGHVPGGGEGAVGRWPAGATATRSGVGRPVIHSGRPSRDLR